MRSVPIAAGQQELRIGARLRDARRRQGLTIDQVARSTGLTKGFISRIERDMTSPSVSTLVTVCAALSLPVGELFVTPKTDVVRAAEAPYIQLMRPGRGRAPADAARPGAAPARAFGHRPRRHGR